MIQYQKLNRSLELLNSGDFNSLYCIGKTGIGKSFQIDKKLNELNANFTVFKGDVTEAKFFEFLQTNNGKIIILRDSGKFLRQISFIDILKQATELSETRHISRLNYSSHIGVPQSFDFTGKIILELNDVGKKYKEDLTAVFSRGLVNELVFSQEEIKQIMFNRCQSDEEKMITKYLFTKTSQISPNSVNLRTQELCFILFKAAIRDNLNWKKEVSLFLETHTSEIRKNLYRLAGNSPVKRREFIKYLHLTQGFSVSTAQRRIKEALELGELFSDGRLKQDFIFLNNIKGG